MAKSQVPVIYQELPNIIPNWKEVNKAESRVIKVFWLLVTLLSVGFLIQSVYFIVVDYLDYPVVTSNKVTISKSMVLPPIYICADNPIAYQTFTNELYGTFRDNLNITLSENDTDAIIKYVLGSFDHELQQQRYSGMFRKWKERKQVEERYQQLLNMPEGFKLEDILIRFGLWCTGVFMKCQIAGISFDCCEKTNIYLINSGKCWKIEPPEGTRGSMVFVMQRDVTPLNQLKLQYLSTDWRIYLDLPEEWRTTYGDLQTTTYTNVEQGTHATLELKPKTIKLLGSPYKPECMKDDDDRVSRYATNRLEFCYSDCEANHTLSKCGCVRVGTIFNATGDTMKLLDDEPICTPTQAIECAHQHAQMVSCDCIMQCRSFDYDVSVTKRLKMFHFHLDNSEDPNNAPSKLYDEVDDVEVDATTTTNTSGPKPKFQTGTAPSGGPGIRSPGANPKAEISITTIQVYYSTLMIQESVQQAKWTLSTLVSTMGGLCSLWMGIRILTLIQLIFYTTITVSMCLRQRKKNSKTNMESSNDETAGADVTVQNNRPGSTTSSM